MKVGSVGYATFQGLGLLLKDFYDNGIVTDVLTIHHWKYINHSWYRGPHTNFKRFNRITLFSFIEDMDAMFFFETPFDREVITYCKVKGVKTILMPMYECTPVGIEKDVDVILNPSLLDQAYYPQGKVVQVPIPRWVEWRPRERARVFVHNAGHLGLAGRNGTLELLQAMEFVKSPIKLVIRSQDPFKFLPGIHYKFDPRVDIIIGTVPNNRLYDQGDVFIFPEKFNGLSLPLQEAYASGMLVMAGNRFPINTWLNTDPLIPTEGEQITSPCNKPIATAVINPKDIAATIDKWYNQPITTYSLEGKAFKEANSWDNLRPTYLSYL